MILTVASFKGGQGKTTTSVHLAALLNQQRPTLLIDGDPNRSASGWAKRKGFPFRVIDERQAVRHVKDFEHIVIDTQAHPKESDLRELALGCDLMVVPMTPDALSLDTLFLLTEALSKSSPGSHKYKVLQTIVPPPPSRQHEEITEALRTGGVPTFATYIRRYIAFQKAALGGVLVNEITDPHARDGWADYLQLAQELAF